MRFRRSCNASFPRKWFIVGKDVKSETETRSCGRPIAFPDGVSSQKGPLQTLTGDQTDGHQHLWWTSRSEFIEDLCPFVPRWSKALLQILESVLRYARRLELVPAAAVAERSVRRLVYLFWCPKGRFVYSTREGGGVGGIYICGAATVYSSWAEVSHRLAKSGENAEFTSWINALVRSVNCIQLCWRLVSMFIERLWRYQSLHAIAPPCGLHPSNNNNNDRLTAFDPGQPG